MTDKDLSRFCRLQSLPEELLHDIFERLPRPALKTVSLTSKWGYRNAAPLIWRELVLTDCRKNHGPADQDWVDQGTTWELGHDVIDEHDDGPLIRKLLVMIMNPWLAKHVRTVTHRCHLPVPAIFMELPLQTFSGQTLSCDFRTVELVKLASANMTRVRTLRIIFGHASITDALLRCFFDSSRKSRGCDRVRRLWLESCRINVGCSTSILYHPHGLPLHTDYSGLERVRFRRLPITATSYNHQLEGAKVYSRSWRIPGYLCQDGDGGVYQTSLDDVLSESVLVSRSSDAGRAMSPDGYVDPGLYELFASANALDDRIYDRLAKEVPIPPEITRLGALGRGERVFRAYRGARLDPSEQDILDMLSPATNVQRERQPSTVAAANSLSSASATLTSINLDWILTRLQTDRTSYVESLERFSLFTQLFKCRFPNLKAFQVRNCVIPQTALPSGLYLLDHSVPSHGGEEVLGGIDPLLPLEFMEAHSNLQCLAWPMDHFYSDRPGSSDVVSRATKVVENLGRSLVDLRIDTLYIDYSEPHVGTIDRMDIGSRSRRRRFISDFAAHMTHLTSIKIEGGVARDERRETLRALRRSPIAKVVLIGVCNPLGNTWGPGGADIGPLAHPSNFKGLDPEHELAVFELGSRAPTLLPPPPPSSSSSSSSSSSTLSPESSAAAAATATAGGGGVEVEPPFVPSYGWPPSEPFLHTIAGLYARTARELKLCGYKGAPILYHPTRITAPVTAALRHFHALERLTLSLWLPTLFEGMHRDQEIIGYWLGATRPERGAVVAVNVYNDDDDDARREEGEGGGEEGQENPWAKALRTLYAPEAVARGVLGFVGPLISREAKGRAGGVFVRASFCIGEHGGIFDLDLSVGLDGEGRDVCMGFEGPRSEIEEGRRRGKLVARRWF